MCREVLVKILDLARWAPSGDNTQPWRFEIVTDNHVAIHGFDTRTHVLYDFDGRPSQMGHGALIETLRIAASGFERLAEWNVRPGTRDDAPIYDVQFTILPGLLADKLLPCIEKRVVQRRPMRMSPLTSEQRDDLSKAVAPHFSVQFFEGASQKMKVARLLWDNAYIRLTCPEAFKVHQEIIEWGVRYSNDRLPEGAIGVDPITAKLMKWVMRSWGRVEFFNRYLMGTIAPRIQLDFIPAMACAAHLLIRPHRPPTTLKDYVESGMAMQRLWLTATANNLYLQPEMTPVIFRWYARTGREISADLTINRRVVLLASLFEALVGVTQEEPFAFFCRVGESKKPLSRSLRKSLSQLMAGRFPA